MLLLLCISVQQLVVLQVTLACIFSTSSRWRSSPSVNFVCVEKRLCQKIEGISSKGYKAERKWSQVTKFPLRKNSHKQVEFTTWNLWVQKRNKLIVTTRGIHKGKQSGIRKPVQVCCIQFWNFEARKLISSDKIKTDKKQVFCALKL